MRRSVVGKILIGLALAAVVLATGCSGKSEKASAEKGGTEEVKVVVWIAGTGDPSYDKSYHSVFDSYCETHPGVSYELSYIAWSEYFTKLNTGLIGGAGPDVFMLGYGQFGTVQNMNVLLPLNDYIPADWDGYGDFYENMLKVGQKDGTQYALFYPSSRVFLYRKDIAAKNGVTEEDLHISSMDDLFALARKMTVYDESGNIKISGLEIDPDQEQTLFVYSSMLSSEFKLWNDDLSAAFDKDYAYEAIQKLYDFTQEGCVSLLDPGSMSSGIPLGTTAMSLQPEMSYSVVNDAFPGQIGIVKNDMNTLLIGNFMAANRGSKNPDVAADFLLHMYSKESLTVFQEIAGQYSGRKSLDQAFVDAIPEMANAVYAYERSFPYSFIPNPKYTAAVQKLRTRLDAVFQGEDVKEMIGKAVEEWNQAVK